MKDLTLLVDEFMEACNCEATIDETAYHFYELGYKECREQMMKDAVEGEAEELYNDGESQCTVSVGTYFKPGDEVYVIKKED